VNHGRSLGNVDEGYCWAFYARCYGMQVLVVRPGWLPTRAGDMTSIGADVCARNYYLSHEDAERFFAAAVATDKW
jgi:hypothetical protein